MERRKDVRGNGKGTEERDDEEQDKEKGQRDEKEGCGLQETEEAKERSEPFSWETLSDCIGNEVYEYVVENLLPATYYVFRIRYMTGKMIILCLRDIYPLSLSSSYSI